MNYSTLISTYGFPIFTTIGISYIIYYIFKWVTTDISPLLRETMKLMKELSKEISELLEMIDRLKEKMSIISIMRRDD